MSDRTQKLHKCSLGRSLFFRFLATTFCCLPSNRLVWLSLFHFSPSPTEIRDHLWCSPAELMFGNYQNFLLNNKHLIGWRALYMKFDSRHRIPNAEVN